MHRGNSHWQRNTDRYTLLLGSFFIVLMVLFGYLFKTDRDISEYDVYHHKLDTLRILNYKLDNFFQQTYRYIDYDDTRELDHAFKTLIGSLDIREVKEAFGDNIAQQIDEVKRLYTDKSRYFEDFKSLNARVTNSIHFLYDLRKTVEEKLVDDTPKKMLLDDIFFSISQILMGLPYDKERLERELQELKSYETTYPMFSYFYQHTEQFLENITKIQKLKHQVAELPLLTSINAVLSDLSQQYQHKRYEQRLIAFSLILIAFILMGFLIYSYRRIRKNTKELQAFRYAIEQSDNAIILTNPNREIEYVNRAFEVRTGYTKKEIIGKNPNFLS